jgi:hypothetical protein
MHSGQSIDCTPPQTNLALGKSAHSGDGVVKKEQTIRPMFGFTPEKPA